MLPALQNTSASMIGSADYQRLPACERKRVALQVRVLAELDKATNLTVACRELSAACGGVYGLSPERLRKKYAAWKKAGRDWRTLVRASKVPAIREQTSAAESALRSPEFLDYYHRLVETYQRSSAAALRELKRLWRTGEPIPGYGNWRAWYALTYPGVPAPKACPGYPEGWSDRNLHRLKPSVRRLALVRDGLKRHAELSAYTPRTTRHLRALELLVADDFRTDFMVALKRPLTIAGRTYQVGVWPLVGIVLMDVASRRIIGWALRPAAKDEDGVRAVIGRADLALLAATALMEYGLPEGYPVEFYLENATATFTGEARGWMAATFGDRVRFKSTGLFDDCLAEFREKGGKAWHKGWIEALFPLVHNELAALPGQIGAHYARKPGDADDRQRYTEKLLKDMRGDDRAADAARLPYLDYESAVRAFAGAVDRINGRTDHALEGFDEVLMWRRSPAEPWCEDLRALALLPPEVAAADAGLIRYASRRQSPAERWAAKYAAGKYARVDIAAVAPLMSAPRTVRVARGMISFEADGERLWFLGADAASQALLTEDAEYLAHWSFVRPDELHLYVPGSLAYAGALPRLRPADAGDTHAVVESAKRVQAAARDEIAAARALHAERAERAEADRAHNAAVLRGDHAPLKLAARMRALDAAPEPKAAAKPAKRRPSLAELDTAVARHDRAPAGDGPGDIADLL